MSEQPKTVALGVNFNSPILGMEHDKLERIFSSERRFAFVAHQVSEGTAKKIRTLLDSDQLAPILKGIRMERVFKRYYPKREIAAQILGWAGVDNQGVTGLELGLDQEFNAWIRGDQLRIQAFRAGAATRSGNTRLALLDEVLGLDRGLALHVERHDLVQQLLEHRTITGLDRVHAGVEHLGGEVVWRGRDRALEVGLAPRHVPGRERDLGVERADGLGGRGEGGVVLARRVRRGDHPGDSALLQFTFTAQMATGA